MSERKQRYCRDCGCRINSLSSGPVRCAACEEVLNPRCTAEMATRIVARLTDMCFKECSSWVPDVAGYVGKRRQATRGGCSWATTR